MGLWAMRLLNGFRMREMFLDMLFMYGVVAVVVRFAVSFVSVVLVGRWVFRHEVFVIVVLWQNTVKLFLFVREAACDTY